MMLKPLEDVNLDSSPREEEEVVNEQPVETTPTETTEVVEEAKVVEPQDVKPEVEESPVKDTRPIENVAWETKRKIDELYPVIQEMKAALQQVSQQSQKPQEPKYSKAQLQAYLQQPDLAMEHRVWALGEVDTIEKSERRREMEDMFNGYRQKTESEVAKRQTYQYVATNFPECFLRDNSGNIAGWNSNHPLTRKIGEYMNNKTISESPEGLMAAAKMAAFDLGYSMNKKLQSKVNQTTAQLRREQKKTLIAGGGATPTQESSKQKNLAKLVEKYQKTRDPDAFKELAKARGLIPQV